jgi:hypothetical protein
MERNRSRTLQFVAKRNGSERARACNVSQFLEVHLSQMKTLRSSVEAWKSDHDRAMACRNAEDSVHYVSHCYDELCRVDEVWRVDAAEGTFDYNKDAHELMERAFHFWLELAKATIAGAKEFRDAGYEVDELDELQARAARAESVASDAKG